MSTSTTAKIIYNRFESVNIIFAICQVLVLFVLTASKCLINIFKSYMKIFSVNIEKNSGKSPSTKEEKCQPWHDV